MKRFLYISLFCLLTIPMMSQQEVPTARTGTSVQIDSSVGMQAGQGNTHRDVMKTNRTVIKEANGFYFFLYDMSCGMARIFDEKYALKIFLGDNYDDALNSLLDLLEWYKEAEKNECMRMTTAEGQKILIQKSTGYGMMMTAGDQSDIEWARENVSSYVLEGIFFSSTNSSGDDLVHTVERRIANGELKSTGSASKEDLKKAIKWLQKAYGKKAK